MDNTPSIVEPSGVQISAVYVLGLGANLGDCIATLKEAARRIDALADCTVEATSRLYRSKAVGPVQPDYYNAAVRVVSRLDPRALLNALLAIEAALGRVRRERWGPRVIDLDILWSDHYHVSEVGLTIPHAELANRAFALAPLLDVAPECRYVYEARLIDLLKVDRLDLVE